jgi:HAE1 family hydrophobic/amphiphilic exporter-1
MKMPSVAKMDSDAWPSLWISINSSRHDELELTRISDNEIKSVLEKLPTVGNSRIFGAKYYSMRIEPINTKMFQHKLSPLDLEIAIREQNKDYPAGSIKNDARNFSLKLNATLNSTEEFKNIIVKKYPDGTIIKLKDIANVSLEPLENDVILRYNGKQSLAVGLIKQSTANIIELSDSVRAELPKIRKNLPAGIKIEVAYDAAIPVKASISSVYHTIFEAIAFVAAVIYLFLGSLRITLIPLVTIPISLIGTFSAMYMLGFTINTFTLLAMILAIGLVVDDAIVMLENIFRHNHELGKKPIQAAFDGSKEIGFAVVAMTITLASVFLPIGFIDGFLGKLFM